jgi:hypothetical protein
MPLNASDLAARAYGCRRRSYPVLSETLGLAVVLLVGRNTARERAVWLVSPVVDDVLCEAAEAFVRVLERRPPVSGWRGGALASLRSVVPGTVHELQDRWPSVREQPLSHRFWLDDQEGPAGHGPPQSLPPVRAELARRLAGRDRLDVALSATIGNYRSHLGPLIGWRSTHEQPESTRRLCADLLAPARAAGTVAWEEPGLR